MTCGSVYIYFFLHFRRKPHNIRLRTKLTTLRLFFSIYFRTNYDGIDRSAKDITTKMRIHVFVMLMLVMAISGQTPVPTITPLDCRTFNASRIKLVTFDVFAALMDIYSSLYRNVPQAAPFLNSSQAQYFANQMVAMYAAYVNHVFTTAETRGMEPFDYVAEKSITSIVQQMHLEVKIPVNGTVFRDLVATWGNLIPWQGTTEVLTQLAQRGFQLAPLSNGDFVTLSRATSIFRPGANMSFIFSSDFPVGAFKPQPAMYAQLSQRSGLRPDEILHVAGAAIDGQGARLYGLYSALLHDTPLSGVKPCFPLANITLLPAVLGL